MQGKKQLIYQFGEFRLEPDRQKLFRAGEQVALPNKAVELLTLLIEERGRTVTKEEILERVWEDAIVEENNLAVNISQLRKVFGETSKEARFIETIPRKGYRFLADVDEIDNSFIIEKRTTTAITIEENILPEISATSDNHQLKQTLRRQSLALSVIGVLVVLLGAGFVYLSWGVSEKGNTQKASAEAAKENKPRTIAVLPLKNLNQKDADEALNIGLTDALITKLGNIRGLIVRPTSAVMRFANDRSAPQEIAGKLNVEAILEGTVQSNGERLRVSVQLVQAKDNQILWSGSFDEKLDDLFKIQDAFAANIAENLMINLAGDERVRLARHETENSEAYELYLKGRYFWNKRTVESLRKSAELFERAKEKDPNFALAYVGLADSYQLLSEYGGMNAAEAFEKARAAAKKAIELDENSGEAHASLAYTLAFYDWNWAEAEREFRRAIELKPNYPTARQWYSEYLVTVGRFDEALAEIRRAQQLDPLSLIINSDLAGHYYMSRQYDKAIEQSKKLLEMDASFLYGYVFLWISYEQAGEIEKAAETLLKADEIFMPPNAALERKAYQTGGWQELWKLKYQQSIEPPLLQIFNDYQRAAAAIRTGDNEKAFYWLEKSGAARNRWFVNLKYDPQWDSLRSDARFAELVKKTNLNP